MSRPLFIASALINFVRLSSAQQATITIPGIAQIALAGAASGTTTRSGRDTAPLNSPVQVNLPIAAGQGIQIRASGLVGYSGSTPNLGPNGDTVTDNTTNLGQSTGMGIAGITGPRSGLVGVFTGATLNLQNIPPAVEYSGDAKEILTGTPMLQQPFFIGSGINSLGSVKTWIAPSGATKLYLGVLDFQTATNTGAFTATVTLASPPDIPTNPVRVSGVAQIALAGAAAGTTTRSARDTAPLNSPVQVNLPIAAGQAIQIRASGLVGYNGSIPNLGPDGDTVTDNTTNLGQSTGMGIAGITGPRSGLVGVFMGDALNLQNIPPATDYSGDARDIPTVTPMLQQPFLVGSGVTSVGTIKTWIAPSGATRLYLGVLDFQTATNTGAFTATVTLASPPDIPTNPVRVSGVAQIALAGAAPGTTTRSARDTAPLNAPASVQVPLVAGQGLIFTAWGLVGYSGSTPNLGPDGDTVTDNTTNLGQSTGMGIAGITGPRSGLVGVFTGATLNLQNIPPAVDFSSPAARDTSNLTPLLQQPFFIGSGRSSAGTPRRVVVPSGAMHLYVGVLDFTAAPNTGAYIVVVSPDAADTPTFTGARVQNAAGFGPNPLAPGSVASVFGANLATQTQPATSVPLPNSIAGTRAYFDLLAAPLYFVSSGQVNLQVPFELNVQQARLTIVRNGSASLPVLLNFSPYAPGIFVAGDGSPIIVNYRTGALISASQPVKSGDVLIIYATGLGSVSVPPASGTPTPLDKLYPTAAPVTALLGSQSLSPDFAGLAPGFIGVYQVNLTVPALLPSQATLQIRVGGSSSNSVPVYGSQ